MDNFSFEDIERLGDAISKHGPTVNKIGEALAGNNHFVNQTGNALCERGSFMDEIADKIVNGIMETIQDKFAGILADMDAKLELHIKTCARASSIENAMDKSKIASDAVSNVTTQRVDVIKLELDKVSKECSQWKVEHKKYHQDNETSWGLMTLLKRHIHKAVWIVLSVATFLLITGLSFKDAILRFTGWDKAPGQKAPIEPKTPPKE